MQLRVLSLLGVALLLILAVAAAVPAAADGLGVTTQVSVGWDGSPPNGRAEMSVISADGRYIAYQSDASNLTPGDTNAYQDIFVYDRVTGQTTRVSVASDGSQGNGYSTSPAISATGRYVAFASFATNLVAGDTNGYADMFVHDQVTGQTERVSVASDGSQGNATADTGYAVSISADGQSVAFGSWASNFAPGDTNGSSDVFLRNRATGVTTLVSAAPDGTVGDRDSVTPAISVDGQTVAFVSYATNLVAGDTNGVGDVFIYDRTTGVISLASVGADGSPANAMSLLPSVSADGQRVAFLSHASNLVAGDTNGDDDVFVRDRAAGVTLLASVTSDGKQHTGIANPALSPDGRFVLFCAMGPDFVVGDTNGKEDVFVHDLATGVTTRVSLAYDGSEGNGLSATRAIAADGRFVAFRSVATNLVASGPGGPGIYLRDRCPRGDCAALHRLARQPDFDATGKADLLWRNAASGQNSVWVMDGPTPVTLALTTPAPDLNWTFVGVDDLDGDGKTDIVARNTVTGLNAVWFMDGTTPRAYAWLPTVADQAWQMVGTGDLNADGKADLVWRNSTTGENGLWLMEGASVVGYAWLPTVADPNWSLAAVGDLNYDNRADLVWRNSATGQTLAWLMNGATVDLYAKLPTVADPAWRLVGVGDLNADEMADLLWRNTATGENIAWLMNGGAVGAYAWLPTVADQNWKLVAVSDLDGDLKADLVRRNTATGQNAAWLMDGGTIVSYAFLPTVADLNWRVVSPTSLMGALNGLLPGPTKREPPQADASAPMWSAAPTNATPMWTEAPQGAKPMWSAAPTDAPPMWTEAPKGAKPMWSAAPKDAPPMGSPPAATDRPVK